MRRSGRRWSGATIPRTSTVPISRRTASSWSTCARARTSTSRSGAGGPARSSSAARRPGATCSGSLLTQAPGPSGSSSRAGDSGSTSTSTSSWPRRRATRATSSASRPLDGSRRIVDGRAELDARLPHPQAHVLDLREALQQRLRDGARQRLEQAELARLRNPSPQLDYLAVVDRLLDAVGSRLGELEANVVQKRLLALALLFLHPMASGDLQPG